jgi:hypothetical protein
MSTRLRDVIDWLFRDPRSGKRVIAQVPNVPILLWFGTLIARLLVEPGTTVHALLAWAGWITLGWWAVDELVRGVNPFRRLLGLGGCAVVLVGVAGRVLA